MKKGFTLIELLAVIVILSVIAVIAMPIVLGVVETTKKAALKESANALIEEAGYYYMQYGVVDNARFDIEEGQINSSTGNTLLLKGYIEDATVLINTKGEVAVCINDGDYSVYKNYRDNKLIEIDNKNCNIPTGQAVVFLENESTIREYTNEELTELVTSLQQEITELKNSTDGNPTGTVISYIAGSTAPSGYLPCDGTVYNISDYPTLANAIKEGFGSYNYYGGDGSTTFAVPDLRGEFLRGTGTNSKVAATTTYGTGVAVGMHQEATKEFYIYRRSDGLLATYGNQNINTQGRNLDKLIYFSTTNDIGIHTAPQAGAPYTTEAQVEYYTIRPTNTSVLYCIKY